MACRPAQVVAHIQGLAEAYTGSMATNILDQVEVWRYASVGKLMC